MNSLSSFINNIIRNAFQKGGFIQNATVLFTGAVISQTILIVIAPILTRLYTPSEFGLFALFASISTLMAIPVTGRYDLAIMLPDQEKDAVNIAVLSFLIITVSSLIFFVIALIYNDELVTLLNNKHISKWLYIAPLSIFLIGCNNVLTFWATREKQFGTISRSRIFNSVSITCTNLIMGIARCGEGGLILGNIAGQGTSVGFLGWKIFKQKYSIFSKINWYDIKQQAKRYVKFPTYSLPADFINTLSQQAPIMLFSMFFNPLILGLFSLTQRVLALPLTFISQSLMGVFQERASSDFNNHGNCRGIFLNMLKGLTLISVIPFIIFILTAPYLFSFIFGESWRVAGEYARILSPMYLLRFISSPLSYVLYVAEKQPYDLIGQIFLIFFSVGSIIIGSSVFHDINSSLFLFSISNSMVYIFYILASYKFSKGNLVK